MKKLPFFLYGTLRPGEIRYHVIAPAVESLVSGKLEKAKMTNTGGFPYIEPAESGSIVGEVCVVKDADYSSVLGRLDAIEGYIDGGTHCFFQREIVTVQTAAGDVECYCYLGGTVKRHGGDPIPSGDWKQRAA
jgi:gamma-glutamylcyclotransferase (GGCT)/AIG2-like uncharacterized protein YtfP